MTYSLPIDFQALTYKSLPSMYMGCIISEYASYMVRYALYHHPPIDVSSMYHRCSICATRNPNAKPETRNANRDTGRGTPNAQRETCYRFFPDDCGFVLKSFGLKVTSTQMATTIMGTVLRDSKIKRWVKISNFMLVFVKFVN